MLENVCSLSSQARTGPLHGIHLFHTGILWSPQDEDTGSSKLGHLFKDLGHCELPHANFQCLSHCQMPHLVPLLHHLNSSMN